MPGQPPPEGELWLWAGPIHKDGYGVIANNGTTMLAHRYSYERFIAPIPDGLVVRHKNDTPLDVNPNNLEIGTQADNIDDMYQRGRNRHIGQPGEYNGMHKLSDSQVTEIRRLASAGYRQRALAAQFGVAETTISSIIHRKSWKHLP